MIVPLAAVAAGAVAGVIARLALGPVLASPVLARENHRGRTLATAAGLVLPLAAVTVAAVAMVAVTAGLGGGALTRGGAPVLAAVLGFALLGLVDDVAGSTADRGFRGHLSALRQGRVTTGVLKIAGGLLVAAVAVAPRAGGSVPRLLADAALVSLCANLVNLLDRAPGRAIKGATAAFAVLVVAAGDRAALAGPAAVVGAAMALALDDLRERLMLGDTGANPLGAAVGLGVVLACRPLVRDAVLVGVALLNGVGELVSFSRVIDVVPPLRALDRAGRRP